MKYESYTGIRPDLAKDQFSPMYIFLQDLQTEIQNTNCKNIDGVSTPILDKEIIFMHLPTLCKNYDGENWSLARSGWMPESLTIHKLRSRLKFLKSRSNFKVNVTRSKIME